MNHGILDSIIVLLVVAVVTVAAFRRLKMPAIFAYLITGAVVGPHGIGWISDTEDTRFLAEFGVVFLLFTVGLEFSLAQLLAMRREVLGLGGAQVLLTTAIAAICASATGLDAQAAFVIGGLLAMSSTAIVTKQLAEQLELNSRHGRLGIAVLLFQDIAVVPFLIIIPALSADGTTSLATELLWALAKGILASGAMLAVGHWLLRPLFRSIAAFHSAELFTLTVLLFSLSAAWLTSVSGLSLALGAFLAGMMMGETEYRHQVESDIRPFRDVLLGLFFVTVGMLLDVGAVLQQWHWVALLVVLVTLGKAGLVFMLTRAFGAESGVALRTGVALAQTGEFGFALLALAKQGDLFDPVTAQIILAVMVISMGMSPFLIRYNGWFAKHLCAASYVKSREAQRSEIAGAGHELSDHVIICGYGRIGQNIARFLEKEQIPYIALDLDPYRVQEAREAGDPVFYGDATHGSILEAAGLGRAKILVISLDDTMSALKILPQARNLRPNLPILARTRDDSSLDKLQEAGATEVVPETFEASLMLVTHLLFLLNIPVSRIVEHMESVRSQRYQLLRQIFPGQATVSSTGGDSAKEVLHAVTLPAEAHAVGLTPAELNFDEAHVILTAIRRGDSRSARPRSDMLLQAGDVLIMYGAADALEKMENQLLKG